ncbi:MAG: hypothetical protein HY956_08980 [Deltaproteobacteria bacterium]|nr:hypothetical protein [Deltaproteobacteria bacterium]
MRESGLTFNYSNSRGLLAVFIGAAALLGLSILLLPPYAPFVLLGIAFLIFFLVEKPETGLLLVVFAAPLMNVMVGVGRHPGVEYVYDKNNFLIIDFFVLIALIGVFIGRALKKVEPLRRSGADLPSIFLLFYATVTLLWAHDFRGGTFILIQLYSCIAIFYLPQILLKSGRLIKSILFMWLVMGFLAASFALVTLYVEFTEIDLYIKKFFLEKTVVFFHVIVLENIKQRVAGIADPNRTAYMLNTALMVGIALLLTVKGWKAKLLVALPVLFIFYEDVHTLSKGGIGSFMVTTICYILIHPRFRGAQIRSMAVLFGAFIAMLAIMSFVDLGGGLGRFGESPVETRGSMSFALRLKWWAGDFNQIIPSYGLGSGVGGIGGYIWGYAQSSYFSLMADLGFIGFLFALWLILSYMTAMYSLLKKIWGDNIYFTAALAFTGAVQIYFIHSIVDFGYIVRIPWLMAGLSLAIARLGSRRLEEGRLKATNGRRGVVEAE